jgi:hypothetical protein
LLDNARSSAWLKVSVSDGWANAVVAESSQPSTATSTTTPVTRTTCGTRTPDARHALTRSRVRASSR